MRQAARRARCTLHFRASEGAYMQRSFYFRVVWLHGRGCAWSSGRGEAEGRAAGGVWRTIRRTCWHASCVCCRPDAEHIFSEQIRMSPFQEHVIYSQLGILTQGLRRVNAVSNGAASALIYCVLQPRFLLLLPLLLLQDGLNLRLDARHHVLGRVPRLPAQRPRVRCATARVRPERVAHFLPRIQ